MREWLVYPPAVDLANTIRAGRTGVIDYFADPAGIEKWIAAERDRIPGVETARRHPDRLRELRDDVHALLHAAARGHRLPSRALKSINQASRAAPVYPILAPAGAAHWQSLDTSPFTEFTGTIARSAIELAGQPRQQDLALCLAPSCGMLFVRDHPRQTWCTPACGNRARVARHAARRRE